MSHPSLIPHPLDEAGEGGVVINPASPLGKELVRWEQHHTYFVGRGQQPGNPYRYREYPKMLYKAQQRNGQWKALVAMPDAYAFEKPQEYERALFDAERFNKSCQFTVNSESEEAKARADGWRESPNDAIDFHEQLEQEMARAAAEAAHAVKRMSPEAQAEFADAETQTHQHVTDVVPKRKRGRPAKGVQPGV